MLEEEITELGPELGCLVCPHRGRGGGRQGGGGRGRQGLLGQEESGPRLDVAVTQSLGVWGEGRGRERELQSLLNTDREEADLYFF